MAWSHSLLHSKWQKQHPLFPIFASVFAVGAAHSLTTRIMRNKHKHRIRGRQGELTEFP